jgi:NTP pyrophosphatase (non-canonical NTP hydrolase)
MEEMTVNREDVVSMVKHWSEVFHLPILDYPKFPERERINLSMELIREELAEVYEGINKMDIREVQDGLGDLLWVTIRAMMEFGIDPVKTIDAIYESNMSKADYTVEDAMKTKAKYNEQGIQTYMKIRYDAFITHRAGDNKVLKSINYKEPKL